MFLLYSQEYTGQIRIKGKIGLHFVCSGASIAALLLPVLSNVQVVQIWPVSRFKLKFFILNLILICLIF